MNKRVIKPMLEFLSKAESGVWMTDFQFHHINYASRDLACTINAGINYNNTTFIIEIEDEQESDRRTDNGNART
jgi:hypothetical protein